MGFRVRGKCGTVDESHRDEVYVLDLVCIVDGADVGVSDLSCQLRLSNEPIKLFGFAQLRDLQRDVAIQIRVVCPVDRSHATSAEEPDNSVSTK